VAIVLLQIFDFPDPEFSEGGKITFEMSLRWNIFIALLLITPLFATTLPIFLNLIPSIRNRFLLRVSVFFLLPIAAILLSFKIYGGDKDLRLFLIVGITFLLMHIIFFIRLNRELVALK